MYTYHFHEVDSSTQHITNKVRAGPTWKDMGSRTALKPRHCMRYMTVRKSCVTALGPTHRPWIMLRLVSKPNLRAPRAIGLQSSRLSATKAVPQLLCKNHAA